jgi:anti-anti-sigma factor
VDFDISSSFSGKAAFVSCHGELDSLASSRLEECLDLVFERDLESLHLDTKGLSLLTSAGVGTFLGAANRCHEEGIAFSLATNKQGRRILDLLGLWWLGVVDDGPALEEAMRDVQKRYADLRFENRIGRPKLGA